MSLLEHLSVVEETRSDINQKHDLIDIIFLVISAITSGCEGWQDIEITVGANKYSPNNPPIKNKSSYSLSQAKHTVMEDRAKNFSPLRRSPLKTIGSLVWKNINH